MYGPWLANGLRGLGCAPLGPGRGVPVVGAFSIITPLNFFVLFFLFLLIFRVRCCHLTKKKNLVLAVLLALLLLCLPFTHGAAREGRIQGRTGQEGGGGARGS